MRNLITCLLASTTACSSTAEQPAEATASLELRVGSDVPKDLSGTPLYDASQTRLVITVQGNGLTALISLATPVEAGTRTTTNPDDLIIWAKAGAGQPLIASAGRLVITKSVDDTSLVVEDVAKPADAFGENFELHGEVRGLRVP